MTRQEAMEIYKDKSSKFINTQSIQWRMNLSIWTLFVFTIFYKGEMNFPLCNECCVTWSCLIQIIIIIFLNIIHGYFCYTIQKSLNFDKAVKDLIIDQLNSTTKDKININLSKVRSNKSVYPWVIIQISITIVLSLVFCFSN
jgi:hypothetical protein